MDVIEFIDQYVFDKDDRKPGRLLETVRVGDVFVTRLTIDPGVVTGNLYHKKTNMILFVTNGTVRFRFKQMSSGEESEFVRSPGGSIIHVPPRVVIANKNIGDDPAVIVYFSNKPFRSGDDFREEIYADES